MSSIVKAEIEHFSSHADRWWDEDGPHAPLHRLNPVRIGYIKDQLGGDVSGLKILDVGCGGGLVCEPLARLGANITGADADRIAIDVAQAHATKMGLDITYLNESVEDIKEQYDAVLALEILEHVVDPAEFIAACAARVKPGGRIIFSTLNRTAQSFALGIVAAEYLLRWVPRGTHSWKQFIKPSELAKMCRDAALEVTDVSGLAFDPLEGRFSLSQQRLGVNYFLSAVA